LIFLSFGIFVTKNLFRINNEMIKYDYHPFKNAYYHIPQDAFYFEKRIFEINQMIKEKDKKYYLILNDNLIN